VELRRDEAHRDSFGRGVLCVATDSPARGLRFGADTFEAALAAGGKDNGAPGVRPHYHESYYAAYVHDPDGNNIEAVCHRPE
jgi:catechol 2,3-dioxygenase-like lactoylglutathione lyase family enzyme